MTVTAQILQRMVAAQKAQTANVKELAAIGRQAKNRHDEIAKGKGKVDADARDASLSALQATADYCNSLHEQLAGNRPATRTAAGHRDDGGKFTKPGSYGHLKRLAQGKG